MKIYLAANAKDEHNIIEWTVYHLMLGFDKIIIYDNMSKYPIKQILKSIPNVIVIPLNKAPPIKAECMMDIVNRYGKECDWMLYLDLDEYLILKRDKEVHSLLSHYKHFDGLAINWHFFGDINKIFRDDELTIDSFKWSTGWNLHVKTLQKTKSIKRNHPPSPHFWEYNSPTMKTVDVLGKVVQPTVHRYAWAHLSDPTTAQNIAYIAHYVHQSAEDYLQRKVLRTRDDTGTYRAGLYNNIQDFKRDFNAYVFTHVDSWLSDNYSAAIKKKIKSLGLESMRLKLKSMHCPRLLNLNEAKLYENKSADEKIQILLNKCTNAVQEK